MHLPVVTLNKLVVLLQDTYRFKPLTVLSRFTFPHFLQSIQRWKITTLFIVPPMVIGLIKNPLVDQYDLSTLRMGMAGAAPLTQEVGFPRPFQHLKTAWS